MRPSAVNGALLACIHALVLVVVSLVAWNNGYDTGYSQEQAERWAKKCSIIKIIPK